MGPFFNSQTHFWLATYLVKIWQKCSNNAKAIIWLLPLATVRSHSLVIAIGLLLHVIRLPPLQKNGLSHLHGQILPKKLPCHFLTPKMASHWRREFWASIGGENFGLEAKIWLWLPKWLSFGDDSYCDNFFCYLFYFLHKSMIR